LQTYLIRVKVNRPTELWEARTQFLNAVKTMYAFRRINENAGKVA
jgi:hypothetical protein